MLDYLVEQRLAEAVSRGEFDDLPGAGRPLDLEEDPLVPEGLRLAHRILKNAGYVPAEVEQINEISRLEALVVRGDADAETHSRALRKLAFLKTRLEPRYYEKTLRKLGR